MGYIYYLQSLPRLLMHGCFCRPMGYIYYLQSLPRLLMHGCYAHFQYAVIHLTENVALSLFDAAYNTVLVYKQNILHFKIAIRV